MTARELYDARPNHELFMSFEDWQRKHEAELWSTPAISIPGRLPTGRVIIGPSYQVHSTQHLGAAVHSEPQPGLKGWK